ncbi:pyridoxal-phosphate dependent enzyme, partial [Burkholderia gladioli]
PRVRVYGVEPTGADVMSRSFAANRPVEARAPRTIADALAAATHTEEYSYELCRRHLERLVTVDDEALRAAMLYLFTHLKTAVEPACAAPIAALLGPLRETLQGRRVGVLLAGSNIEAPRFAAHLEDARRGH